MPEPFTDTLRREFRDAGLAPREIDRLVGELEDHYEDLLREANMAGLGGEVAARDARQRLGNTELLVKSALIHEPVACLTTESGTLQSSENLARWSMAIFSSGLFTAVLFFVLQFAITP